MPPRHRRTYITATITTVALAAAAITTATIHTTDTATTQAATETRTDTTPTDLTWLLPTTPPATTPPATTAATAASPTKKIATKKATAPPPATTTVTSPQHVLELVTKYFPADQIGNAIAIAQCESGQTNLKGTRNTDGTRDWGIFQLNDGGTLQTALTRIGITYTNTADATTAALNPDTNIKAASSIYADRGWAPWVCAHKQRIVAVLYTNTPGPMNGHYTTTGTPTTSATSHDTPANNKPKKKKPKKKPSTPILIPKPVPTLTPN